MLEAADTNGWRVVAYLIVVCLAVWAYRYERRRDLGAAAWPTFWLLSAGLLLAMAVGSASHIGAWLVDLVRDQAVARGWYDNRRSLQAAVVGLLGGGWFVTVALACWQIRERRRRYLPASLVLMTMGAFAAVRIVSLHQIDGVLHRRFEAGLRVDASIEFALLTIMAVVTVRATMTSAAPRTVPASEDLDTA